jgi:class 3 adenylate cyclase
MLEPLFDRLDRAAERLGVYRVETIGDAYICATNMAEDQAGCHAALLARFALAAVGAAGETLVDEADPSRGPVRLRVGLHSGPCMACVVGRRSPKYTLLGDTVNTASRMESTSAPGRIQCSARTAEAIRAQDPAIRLERRGVVEVKGKGSMETFWVLPSDGADGGGGCDPDCRIDVLGTADIDVLH